MLRIESIKHPKIVEARSLTSQAGRAAASKALLYSKQQIEWAVAAGRVVEYAFSAEEHALSVPLYLCSEGILKKISGTSYVIPLLAVMRAEQDDWPLTDNPLVVLDHVVDYGNLGTIVRTASAFGLNQFLSTTPNAELLQRKTIDASRGAALGAQHQSLPSPAETARYLKAQGYQIVATTPVGSSLQSLAKLEKKPAAIVFGNESDGVSPELLEAADLLIQIPMSGPMESLNVGVAAGITLYELQIKVVMTMLVEKIQASLGRNLRHAVDGLRGRFDEKLRASTPLNAEQAIALMILKCEGPLPTQALGVEVPSPHVRLDGDHSHLTKEGEEILAQIWVLHEQAQSEALAGFTVQEKEQFLSMLRRVAENVSENH